MGTDQTAELSDAGYQFLIDLFNRHDKVRIDLHVSSAAKKGLLLY